MQTPISEFRPYDRVADFYVGKCVFITGASGYLGSVLLESLLRCCSGVQNIFILLREKKGINPLERKKAIFQKKIFDPLKEENPDVLDKVYIVEGDISFPNLGMRDEDYKTITQEVSIIFHSAAMISFLKPLDFILKQNVSSVDYVIQLARNLKKLDALIYVSTAYANTNRKRVLKECIYRLPFHSQKFLDALNSNNVELLSELVEECKPSWPNNYTFSKSLAENVLLDKAFGLPVVIVRPSLISSAWKAPLPGYAEDTSAASAMILAVGRGYVKVILCDKNTELNWIPVDVVANTLIVSAWGIATSRIEPLFVVNCVLHEESCLKMPEFVAVLEEFVKIHTLPKTFQTSTSLIVTKSRLWYKISTFVHHYIPAYVIDTTLRILGKQPKMTSLYKFYDLIMELTAYFILNCWEFQYDNFQELQKLLQPEDKEFFNIDMTGMNLADVARQIPNGAPFYDPEIDRLPLEQRKRLMKQRYWGITAIKCSGVFLICVVVYFFAVLLYRLYQTFTLENYS